MTKPPPRGDNKNISNKGFSDKQTDQYNIEIFRPDVLGKTLQVL